jgi:hypothetical protein
MNRENTYNLVTSTLTKIEHKPFPCIVEKYLLVFADVAFYRIRSVPPIQECHMAFKVEYHASSNAHVSMTPLLYPNKYLGTF